VAAGDPSEDQTAALVLAVVTFIVFAALIAGLATKTFDQAAAAWVGAGLVGLGSAVFAGWALALRGDVDFARVERVGGDLLLVGAGVFLVFAGLPTFFAGVL
jgi:hypothetical protein